MGPGAGTIFNQLVERLEGNTEAVTSVEPVTLREIKDEAVMVMLCGSTESVSAAEAGAAAARQQISSMA